MGNEEAIKVLELAVEIWHQVANRHAFKTCNCFRDEFGSALIDKFDIPLYGKAIK